MKGLCHFCLGSNLEIRILDSKTICEKCLIQKRKDEENVRYT